MAWRSVWCAGHRRSVMHRRATPAIESHSVGGTQSERYRCSFVMSLSSDLSCSVSDSRGAPGLFNVRSTVVQIQTRSQRRRIFRVSRSAHIRDTSPLISFLDSPLQASSHPPTLGAFFFVDAVVYHGLCTENLTEPQSGTGRSTCIPVRGDGRGPQLFADPTSRE